MSDFDTQCDRTIAAARKTVAESEELANCCDAAFREKGEWERANGVDGGKLERFFASLSPEDRKKVEEENELFNQELAHDLERAVRPVAKKSQGGRRRSYA